MLGFVRIIITVIRTAKSRSSSYGLARYRSLGLDLARPLRSCRLAVLFVIKQNQAEKQALFKNFIIVVDNTEEFRFSIKGHQIKITIL
jgi:hypothetical protein